jgi:uncharacterized protein
VTKFILAILITAYASLAFSCEEQHFTIGTGSKGAVFYPTIKTICDNFNNSSHEYKCHALISPGAKDNLDKLTNHSIDLAVSQYDLQNQYYQTNPNIRSVMQLHSEYFTILVKDDLSIDSLSELKNLKINIGNIGSGSRIFFEEIIKSLNLSLNDFSQYTEAKSSEIDDLFCQGKIDAAIYLVGHPNKIFRKALKKCNGKLVSLPQNEIDSIIKQNSNFTAGVIKSDTYPNTPNIRTISMPIILSTNKDINKDFINKLIRITQDDLKKLRRKNVVFNDINITIDNSLRNKIAPLYSQSEISFD